MKKIVNSSKLMLASLLIASVAFSCKGVDPIPEPAPEPGVVEVPKYEGEIKLSRERIGDDQMFEVKYTVPTGGKNVELSKYSWGWLDETEKLQLLVGGNVDKDRVASIRVQAPYVGECTLAFQGFYLNLIDRSKPEVGTISKKITVVKCDVGTSFWGDSEALVRSSAAEKEFFKADNALNATGKSWILQRDKTVRTYSFTNDKLTQVVERRASGETKSLLIEVNGILTSGARKLWGYSTPVSFDVIELATGIKTAIVKDKIKEKTYTDPICNDVANGKSEIVAVAKSDKTTMTISLKMSTVGMITTITYTPNAQ